MYVARVFCPDPECAEQAVVEAGDMMELVAALCDCGCGYEIRGLPDWVDDPPAAPVPLPRRSGPPLDIAA
jgi:hypothetical protein